MTDWNAERRAQGHADVPLNELGRAQAATLAPTIAAFSPTRLWTSDLARALQTAEYLAEATGLPIEADARFREYDIGKRSGLTVAEFAEQFPEEHAAWLVGDERRLVAGEETTEQVHDRVLPALQEAWQALQPGETGVVVLHGACLIVGLMGMLGWPWDQYLSIGGLDNCAYSILSEDLVTGRMLLRSYNEKAACAALRPDFATDGPVG